MLDALASLLGLFVPVRFPQESKRTGRDLYHDISWHGGVSKSEVDAPPCGQLSSCDGILPHDPCLQE